MTGRGGRSFKVTLIMLRVAEEEEEAAEEEEGEPEPEEVGLAAAALPPSCTPCTCVRNVVLGSSTN